MTLNFVRCFAPPLAAMPAPRVLARQMQFWWVVLLSLFVSPVATAAGSGCQRLIHAGNAYSVCRFDAAADLVRLFYAGADGQPFRTFSSLSASVAARGQTLTFAMNAGMYHEDRSPVGLLIEDGVTRAAVNTADAVGNFYLKPNGVFFVADGRAGVVETAAFLESKVTPQYATQSGPMLVIDGALHPKFKTDSTSRNIRNGVGVAADGHAVVFAMSEAPVTFFEFAVLFRDALASRNALYLDGAISRLYAPALDRNDPGADMGPIVGVTVAEGQRP